MTTSRRARIARKGMRRFGEGAKSIEQQRADMDQLDRLPRPRRVDYVETGVGGVPAIVASPTSEPPDRHILYLHGGGYVIGSAKSHIAMAARLAKRAAATATVLDYRLAPEHPYPAAIDDCVAAYRAMAAEVDPALITIAGDSAGGGAALATLVTLRDAGDPLPGCAYLLSPWTDLTASGETVVTKADADPMIDPDGLENMARLYAGDTPLGHSGVSPLFADLVGLPPMLIQTGVDEVLLSDSTRLADRARGAGIEVVLDLADGMWHVYQALSPFVPEATDALTRGAVFIRSRTPAQPPHAA